jgi:dihydrolipoamide dehydrogenase
VLPYKDPEVAAALEEEFLGRGVKLLKGARATGVTRDGDKVVVACDDGRRAEGSHAVFTIGFVPNSASLNTAAAGVTVDERGFVPGNRHCQTNVPHIYSAGDLSGRLPLSSVGDAGPRSHGTRDGVDCARTVTSLRKAASAIFTDPRSRTWGSPGRAFAAGRKLRVTKVPFSSNPKALIGVRASSRSSRTATGVVLGGSVVGRSAAS